MDEKEVANGGDGPKDVKFLFGLPTDSIQNICKQFYSEAGCSREVQPEQSLSLSLFSLECRNKWSLCCLHISNLLF